MQKAKQTLKSKYLRLMTGVGIILAGCIIAPGKAEQAARIGAAKLVAEKALPAILSNLDKLTKKVANPANCTQRHELIKKYAQIAGDADMPPISQNELQNHFFKGCLDEKPTTPPPSRPRSAAPDKPPVPETQPAWKSAVPSPQGRARAGRGAPPRPQIESPSAAIESQKARESGPSEAQKATEASKTTLTETSQGANIRQSQKQPKPLPTPKRRPSEKELDGPPQDLPPQLPPDHLPPPLPSAQSGMLAKKPTAPKDSTGTATKSGSQKTALSQSKAGHGGLLSELQNENPMARLKKTGEPVVNQPPSKEEEGVVGVFKKAMQGVQQETAETLKPEDKAKLEKLIAEGKKPQDIRTMMDDDFDLFHNEDAVREELKKLEKH